MSSIFGGQQVNPQPVSPVIGTDPQKNLYEAIVNSGNIQNYGGWPTLGGIAGYPGQVNPNTSSTLLPSVWGNWQAADPGIKYLSDALYSGAYNPNNTSPVLKQMMQWGGTGGPGNNAMSLMMQYGAPSVGASRGISSMLDYGVASRGSGQPLSDLAYGQSPLAKYLAPFLTAKPYQGSVISPQQQGLTIPAR